MRRRLVRPWLFCLILSVCASAAGCGPGLRLEEKLRVAGVFSEPVGSPGADPGSEVIHQALLRAQRDLDVLYDFRATVSPADFERIVRDYARRGYGLIMGDAAGQEDTVRRVAREFPDVAFCFASSLGPAAPNFSVFDFWNHEPAYLCGLLAGSLTGSGKVAVVAGEAAPRNYRVINAFRLGVKEANPDARVLVAFAGRRNDPPAARRLAEELIDRGADLLYAATPGPVDVCRRRGVPVFGHIEDQHSLAVNVMVTSAIWDPWPMVRRVIEDVHRDRWAAADYSPLGLMFNRGSNLAPYRGFEKNIPFEAGDLVHRRRLQILAGLHRVPLIESEPDLSEGNN